MLAKNQIIVVQGREITLINIETEEFISLTDIAKYRNTREPFSIINNWMRNRSTIEFIGLWETLNNPNFKPLEFERFKNEAGSNYFLLSPQKWVESTQSIGIISKSGRYGGTFAHIDIALEFASWISPEFKLYIVTEFKRLKKKENTHEQLEWSVQRTIAKINYRIHTDAIKEALIPSLLTSQQKSYIYADEADLLNVALFGKTAKQWRDKNPKSKGNIRDEATIEQLVVLSNLESINSVLIRQELTQAERLEKLNNIAISQMSSLLSNPGVKKLKG